MFKALSDRALAAWVRLRYGRRGDFVQQGLLWALVVVVAIGVLTVIGTRMVNKFQALNNALS